jgi:ribonuclease J
LTTDLSTLPTLPSLQVLPLGGVARIGMNAMLVGCGDEWLLLDCGVAFPEPDQTGVELVQGDRAHPRPRGSHRRGAVCP